MLETKVIEILQRENMTLAVAESCTGGLVAKCLTDVPGASRVFVGGVVSYTNPVKQKALGVKASTLAAFGAVSRETACEMASGVQRKLGADIGMSVTGVAGPDKDDRGNEVGTVYIGISTGKETIYQEEHFSGSRSEIREAAKEEMFSILLRMINKGEENGQ